jgi:hypothetical protein
MTPSEILIAIRDLVAAAEEAGWDQDNPEILNRGREAHASLQFVLADAEEPEA